MFPKSRLMRVLWGKILAGEVRKPNSFSLRTLETLRNMSTDDAKLFSKLCGFNCRIGGEIQPLVYNEKAEIYTGNGVNFSALNHLETIGLINFNSLSEYVWNLSAHTVLVA